MKRILCLALALFLLAGCAVTPGATWAEAFDRGGPERATIAYVPLDDRPVNTTRVQLLAQSAGFRLRMPEKQLYRTALDGQPANANGTRHGDGDALLRWLETVDADYYVISMDQILSGGLVHSRWETEISHEQQTIHRLLAAVAGKKVILLDTVMRLAPTVGYGGCTLAEYEALRAYGQQSRPSLVGDLTADLVIAGYPVATDLEETVISQYLAARSRKLRLAEYLLKAVSGKENILLLYGVDDSSPENNIQTNEIAFIKQHLGQGCLFAGTDEMGLLAVARMICGHGGGAPKVGVRYFGADPQRPADAYDVGPLKDNVEAHLAALGLEAAADAGDLELLVFGGEDPAALLEHYRGNLQKGLPTMIVDLGEAFALPNAMVAADVEVSCLLSYSSWNTAGNAIGIALANGLARYAYLKQAAEPVKGANSAFVKGLTLSFAKDVSYGAVKARLWAADEAGALGLVRRQFAPFAQWMAGKRFLLSLRTPETGTMPQMTVAGLTFPWGRTFEAELEIGFS